MPSRRSFLAFTVGCVALGASACGGGGDGGASVATNDDEITVASFSFPESVMLAELYSQALEAHGFGVKRAFGLGPREFVAPALEQGLVELVPEYAGSAATFFSLGAARPTRDPAETHATLVDALDGEDIVALDGAPAQNANTFVVTAETADEYELAELSELRPLAPDLRFGGPPECPTRPLCLAGLEQRYDLEFDRFVTVDAGGPLTHQALRSGAIDVGLLFTSDPAITSEGLVELVDDLGLQPAENVTPLIHRAVLQRWGPDVAAAVDAVSAALTTAELRALNAAIATDDADPAAVAAEWLRDKGLT